MLVIYYKKLESKIGWDLLLRMVISISLQEYHDQRIFSPLAVRYTKRKIQRAEKNWGQSLNSEYVSVP